MCSFGSCQMRFEFLSQFRKVRNAFVCFVTQVRTHLPKTKLRLAYEDKRDLYCMLIMFFMNYMPMGIGRYYIIRKDITTKLYIVHYGYIVEVNVKYCANT